MTTEQIEALADEYYSDSRRRYINQVAKDMADALREIAATMRKGRLTDERIDSLWTDYGFHSGFTIHTFAHAIADAAVLAALPELFSMREENADLREVVCNSAESTRRHISIYQLKIEELSKQRDELAKALEALERTAGIAAPYEDPAREAARAALAKVKP